MDYLRTADERFADLPAYGFGPHYHLHAGLRMHYVDEGPRGATVTALCLHGNPSWGYLYRHMLPVFTAAGLRVVVPDLLGFGRSDKPLHEAAHTWELHRGSLLGLIEALNLRNILLVCQDWGGLFGLTLPMALPESFTRLLVMNTTLAQGELTEGFRQWRAYSNSQPDLAVGKLLRRGKSDMSELEATAYDAPFPDASFKAALRAFPNLVPEGAQTPGAVLGREAARYWREQWRGQAFMAVGQQDPVLGGEPMRTLQALIRGCAPALQVPEGGHFLPEWGEPIARQALEYFHLA